MARTARLAHHGSCEVPGHNLRSRESAALLRGRSKALRSPPKTLKYFKNSTLSSLESSRLSLLQQTLSIKTGIEPLLLEIILEPDILALQIPLFIRDQEPCNQATNQSKGRADEKHALLALLRIRERILDGREDLRPDRGTRLSHGGCEAHVVASQRGGERLGGAEEGGDAGAHLTQGVEDTVHDDEQREHALDGPECAAEDEAEDAPEEEAERHCLLTADLVHEETAHDAAREVEAVDHCAVADVLDERVVGIQLADNG